MSAVHALPRDAALSQLARALDASAMAEVFAEQLTHLHVAGCEVERVKYRPGRNASILYRLQLVDRRGDASFEQRVATRLCMAGQSRHRHRQALRRRRVDSAAGPQLTLIDGLDMVAHWLPNDAKLGVLQWLADDTAMQQRVLPFVVQVLAGGRGRLLSHEVKLVQVVPETRVCARVTLHWEAGSGSAPQHTTLYAKADLNQAGEASQAILAGLANSEAVRTGRLRTPLPLCWQPEFGLHWQHAVPGRPLLDEPAQPDAQTLSRIGRQLGALHVTPLAGLPTTGAVALTDRQAAAAALLLAVDPAWRPLLDRLVPRLGAGVAALADEPLATLHGDLHARNILLDAGEPAFIDLDGAHRGPAVLELGGWLADACHHALLEGRSPVDAWAAQQPLLHAHAEAVGRSPDPRLLAWSTAHHLLCRRACGGIGNLKPGRYAAVPALLALADTLLATGRPDAGALASWPEAA